jgi:hypothetical protein
MRLAATSVVIVSWLVLAGCAGQPAEAPEPSVCDGIEADMGGCSELRPAYTGDTCDEVAAEWGPAVETLVTPIFDEPPVVGEQQRSSRILDALILASVTAAMHLDDAGLLGTCRPDAFVAAAEAGFSAGFRGRILSILYDGEPVATWDQLRFELRRGFSIIDVSDPASPSS